MSFWKKALYGILGISAILGRRTLSATYDRQIENITDAHIKYVGGALLFGVCGLVLNFIFLMLGWHGMQTALFGVICLASLYYLIAPKLSIPLIGAAAAIHAGEEGDQANIKLLSDGVKDIVNLASLALFWIGVYIVGTIIAPWDLSWEFFLFLHMFIIMALLLFVSGKASVSTKVYDNCFKITIGVIVVGVLTIMIGREHVGPLWAQLSASKTSRIEAQLTTTSIKNADDAAAAWIKKNVYVNDRGEQVVIVTDKATGKQKPVAAQPYIEREKQRRNETIRSVTERGRETDATKAGQNNKASYLSYEYWNAKAHEWSESWGMPLFVGILAVPALIIAHFIPVIWGGKKLFGQSAEAATKKADGVSGDWEKGFVVALLVMGALGFIGYVYTQTEQITQANGVSKTNVATHATLKKEDTCLWIAYWSDMNGHSVYRLPQDRWHGQSVSLLSGSSVTDVSDITLVFDPSDPNTNISFNGDCVAGSYGIQKECVGQWRTGVGSGAFRLEWEEREETFHISMYAGQLPARGKVQPIKEIRFVKKQ